MTAKRFENKVAIITGSSNGIGRATALLFAEEGAQVTITGRNSERLEETRKLLIENGVPSENINSVIGDITESEVQEKLISSTINSFGKIDILVNNAGALIPDKLGNVGIFQNVQILDDNFNLNVRSVVELTQRAFEYLEASRGEIVNVSSIASGPQGHSAHNYYSISKAAIDQLTRNLALQFIPHGIRVNCVNPGIVSTGFFSALGLNDEQIGLFTESMTSDPSKIPSGEMGKPEEIAKLIAFLADRNSSSYIIGQTITIDGGSTLVMGMLAGNSNLGKS
ncbi:unnamed protein product [Caenorhabditis angaria]|uniref:Uncharacterized protein n=1 Tax=Caenorhabditis angaria TaxID=860376 RepID=A0A9P1IXD2_9PELO|nr:unnamed protein product [Caenorhabditis angaria]